MDTAKDNETGRNDEANDERNNEISVNAECSVSFDDNRANEVNSHAYDNLSFDGDTEQNKNKVKSSNFFSDLQRKAGEISNQWKNSTKQTFKSISSPATQDNSKGNAKDKTGKHAKKRINLTGVHDAGNKEYNSRRKATKIDASKYRRGPIPIDSSDRYISKITHGTIDSDDEDYKKCLPSSRGLLVYFATLGQSTEENEFVDLKFVDSLLEAGADINHEDRYGQTVLHAIARDWHIDVAKYALEHGAKIDNADVYGRTALHLAAAVDYHEMVEFLILNGAFVDVKTKDGQTPLHFACKNNASNTIKTLIKFGARINDRDEKLRTPLFVAAESGRAAAVKTLLDEESPAGVYDVNGNSAMALMVEKMPSVAYEALSQFYVDDRAMRRKYYYLNQLESAPNQKENGKDLAKSALEMIVVYKETDLVMHPVIQKMIDVKWRLFARKKSWIDLIINLFYTLIWVILALLIPRDAKFYQPVASKFWRIILEAIFGLLTIYFIVKEVRTSNQMRNIDWSWREWSVRNLENELESCHPKWPDERKYVENEISRVWNFSGTYSRNIVWSVYEWLCLLSIVAVAATQVYYLYHPTTRAVLTIYSVTLSISVMMICLRIMKICRAFKFLSAFIVLLGHVFGATMKFAFLFFEFFIPYVCIMWLIFGGPENAAAIEKTSPGKGDKFRTFDEIIYITWLMTVTADIPFKAMVNHQRVLASIIVGTYYALVSVVCINLYIALMSETFTRVYKNAEANASLQQALLIIFLERQMGPKESNRTKKYLQTNCSPLEDIQYDQQKSCLDESEMEMKSVLGNISHQLNTVNVELEESKENSEDKEAEYINELSKRSKFMRNQQDGLLKEMEESLDNVSRAQEGITRALGSIVKKISQDGKGKKNFPYLRRSRSSNSLT